MAKRTSSNLTMIPCNNEIDSATSKTSNANALKIKIDHLKTFEPLTDNQKKFYDAYKRGDYFVALHGVAGTGKTFIALYKALEEVLDKSNPFKKIIIVRSANNNNFFEWVRLI